MRIVIQRVSHASVTIEGEVKSAIKQGYLILFGVEESDTSEDVDWLVKKVIGLRVFDDENLVMNRSIMDINGEILVISQFTLFASYKKGNRPSWYRAAKHEISVPLYEEFCKKLSEALGKPVGTGEFGADMKVELLNDGPVTIMMDTHTKSKEMTIKEAQETVDKWIKEYGVRYFSELTNMACLTEEVGELARVIARTYGDQSFKPGEKPNLGEEMADVLWVLICLANQTGIDLTEELQKSFAKKTKRDAERHKNNPKLKDN